MTNDVKNSFPEIPWGKIEKMRHLLVHQYRDVHLKTVWDIALYHIPEFEKELNRVERWIDAQKKTGFPDKCPRDRNRGVQLFLSGFATLVYSSLF
ncbi:MAG: DUF86 domain-containing protein [Flavobacteriaceae bacterium]|nr:DUF86 domain-containing protein [Flavobacteriaceae bacterium]